MHIYANTPVANTFGFDIKARYVAEIYKGSDIKALRSDPIFASLPWQVLGDGSNVLLTHDIQGVLIRCGYDAIKVMNEDDDHIWISVGGGYKWHKLVEYTVEKGWWGLENLALIPGTVGAAPVQNIGAFGVEVQDVITRVQTLDLFNGDRKEFRNKDCEFEYRSSIFKRLYGNQKLIHRVTFHLRKRHAGAPQLLYDLLAEMVHRIAPDPENISPKNVFDAVIALRNQRLPDPKKTPNAGSFFHNPIISAVQWEHLKEKFPQNDIPHFPHQNGHYKIPAGWLIEMAGWKGYRENGVGVCQTHALVLINYKNGEPEDLKNLAKKIQQDVLEKYGIHLLPEVNYID